MSPRAEAPLHLAFVATVGLLIATHVAAAVHNHSPQIVLAPGYADLQFEAPRAGTYRLPSLGAAADGAVLSSSGTAERLHDLIGEKITVLSFIFTMCSDVNGCPLATHVLRGVQDRLRADSRLADRVRLLSLSFDPAHDTPDVLSTYGAHFAKPGFDWQFLTTAGEGQLTPILTAYDQWVQKDYDAQGNYIGSMSHILRVYLIDRQRRIRNIYSTSFLHADTLLNDIRTLELEAQAGALR
jgi:cytochrome c peroxidase